MTNKRNGAFDWWKFVFIMAYVIFSSHLLKTDGRTNFPEFLARGSLAVDFFFILAGMMLAKHVNAIPADRTFSWSDLWRFMRRRLSRFYPAYALCWLVSFIAVSVVLFEDLRVLFCNAFTSMTELLLIRNAGFNSYRVMSQTWTLSAGMISLFILYPLYRRHKKAFEYYIAPVGALLLFGYICYAKSSLVGDSDYLLISFKCTYRALGEILMGVTCFVICRALVDRKSVSKKYAVLLSFAEIGGYLAILLYMRYYYLLPRYFDFLFVGVLAWSMMITLSEKSALNGLFDHRLFYFLGRFSLYPFLTFKVFTKILPPLMPGASNTVLIGVYFVLTLVSAAALMAMERPVRAAYRGLKRLIVKPKNTASQTEYHTV